MTEKETKRFVTASQENLAKPYPEVFLRFQYGLLTKKLAIPRACLAGEYKVPVLRDVRMGAVSEMQDYITPLKNTPCLVFRWDRKSYQSTLPIMDLVDVYLI